MERILGKVKIKGFRAPCFSIDNRNKWALRVLLDFGYQYDASIFPLKINPLYGISGAPTRPYRISFEDVRKEDPPKSPHGVSLLPIDDWEAENSHFRRILLEDPPASFSLLGIEEDQSISTLLGLLSSLGGLREDTQTETASLQSCDFILRYLFGIEKI